MKSVTNTYTLAYLAVHPITKEIIHKYLSPLVGDMKHIEFIDCTLDDLAIYNMGGGIPYEIMMLLKKELNTPAILNSLSC
jgi:hypothetical protein